MYRQTSKDAEARRCRPGLSQLLSRLCSPPYVVRQGLSLNLELMFCGKASSQQALVIIMSAPNGAILQDMKPLIADYTVLRPKCGSAELGSKANAYL